MLLSRREWLGLAVFAAGLFLIRWWLTNRDRAGGSRSPLHDPTKGVFV